MRISRVIVGSYRSLGSGISPWECPRGFADSAVAVYRRRGWRKSRSGPGAGQRQQFLRDDLGRKLALGRHGVPSFPNGGC